MENLSANQNEVKVSLIKSEKTMATAARAAGQVLAANLFSESFAQTANKLRRDILTVFLNEYKELKKLGGKNAAIFKETCKDVFSGLYDTVSADTFKACRADAIEAYKERIECEKKKKAAAKVEGAISAAVALGLSEDQAAALLEAGLLKF